MGSRERLIRQLAVQRGLDPDAVVAISSVEGANALHGGVSIGDHGTSFGPFQLHVGGALPAGKGSAWAHSRAGIAYAEDQMAKVAGGLKGKAAVSAISSRFERPADVPGEIAKAMGYYGKGGGGPIGSMPAGGGALGSVGGAVSGLTGQSFRSMMAAEMLQQSAATAAGQKPDSSGLLALAMARRQLDAAQQSYGPKPTTGPLGSPPRGGQVGGRLPFLGATQGEKPGFLQKLQAAASSVGGTKIRVTSGYRSPEHNRAIGGAPNSNHTTGHAMDGQVFIPGRGWVPLGTALKGVAGKYGLRSGDQPGFFNGGVDPVHVDDGFNLR